MSLIKSTTSIRPWPEYRQAVNALLAGVTADSLGTLANMLRQVRQDGGTVYVLGNGGSQANASHLSLHLQEVELRARDIHAELPLLTAWSNDHDFSTLALNSLRRDAQIGDALVVVSGSGDSPNILVALAESRRIGIRTMGLLGFGGGAAKSLCDCAVVLPGRDYGALEDTHSAIIHYLKILLKQ